MRCRVPHNMSLSFSIDRILSPDFGPCKSRVSDSTCSVNGLPVDTPQGLCKSEDFSYKKLVTDTCKILEMPPSTEMNARAAFLSQMISVIPSQSPKSKFLSTGKPNWNALKNEGTDILISPDKKASQQYLENLNILSATSDYISVTPCSAPLTKVAYLIEDIGLVYEKNFQPSVDCSEQSSSPLPFRLNLSAGAGRNKSLAGKKTATSFTKEASSPCRKYEDTNVKTPEAEDAFTKTHQEDKLLTDETEIYCDTKPQVPEELFQNDDRCLSGDGRCSSSSVDTLSSNAESDSNHTPTTSGLSKTSFGEIKTVIKESLSDGCADSPPTSFSDTKVEKSSTPNHKLLSEDLGEIIPTPGEGWPVWVYCNRYSARPSSGPRSRRQSRKMQSSDEKRCRTAFSMLQLNKLHMAFESNPYLCEKRRNELARDLQLSESQVKIWFQNRRAKVKKATGTKNPLAALLKEQGLYNHSTTKA